jgi:hypothetical protein
MNEDRIGRDEAERILRDAAGGPRPGQDALTAFLAVAAAPAAPAADEEFAGEEAAATAFRRARLGPPPRRRRPLIARVLTVKTAVALGFSATAIGGVALAAGTGTLPGPIGGQRPASHQTSARPATTPPSRAPHSGGGAGGTGGTPTSVPSSASPVPSPSPTPPSATPRPPGNGNGNANGHDKKDKRPKKSHSPRPAESTGKKPSQ